MSNMDFIKGLGAGMVAGATIGMAIAPKRKNVKCLAGKALKTVGTIVENISDAIGI